MHARIYQLLVILAGVEPPIWRRVQVPSDITFSELHDVLQSAMGWFGYHLHRFVIENVCYGEPDPDEIDLDEGLVDERRVRLDKVVGEEGRKFLYEYDFGDGWEHCVELETILPAEANVHYPVCVGGARNCLPEDCGGPPGCERFLAAIRDSNHPQHRDMFEWIGGEFDPEEFDLDAVNQELQGPRRA